MTDADLIEFVTNFRTGIIGNRGSSASMCYMVCAPLTTLLELEGVPNMLVQSHLSDTNHFWLKLQDGRALDPTADQFNGMYGNADLPPVYLGPPTALHKDNVPPEVA